jgi:hypothetical protein
MHVADVLPQKIVVYFWFVNWNAMLKSARHGLAGTFKGTQSSLRLALYLPRSLPGDKQSPSFYCTSLTCPLCPPCNSQVKYLVHKNTCRTSICSFHLRAAAGH